MTELLVQVAMGFFGILLMIITGLMAWMTKEVVKASGKIAILERALDGMEKLLSSISIDLKVTGRHDSEIAVLQNEVGNLKADMSLVSEKFREIDYNAKVHPIR